MSWGPNHNLLDRARDHLASGRLSRRRFVRLATLFGLSAASAYRLAALPEPAAAQTVGDLPFPAPDPAAEAGGILRIGMNVQKMEDPALFSWGEMANQARHVLDYLATAGPDNIVRPMLASGWRPSDDLRVWEIRLREGVTWHNGDPFTAEDVAWNVRRWLEPTLGSANIGLSTFAAMVEETGDVDAEGRPIRRAVDGAVEVVDRSTLRLHLTKPVLSVPEDFSNYASAIVHPSFRAPWSDNPIGTGAFTLKELVVGERCILERIQTRTDGEPFTYWGGEVFLDEIHYYGFSVDNQLVALAGGDVDAIFEFGPEQLPLAQSLPGKILAARTAYCLVLRMQVDVPPFDDARVRNAVQLAVDNSAVAEIVFAEDADVGNTDGVWQQGVCEAIREQVADAGIRLNINLMPPSKYWEIWTATPFGATSWAHRPLGTMVLSQAYRTGVPWNESHFASAAFDEALDAAEATFDPAERRLKMEAVQRLLQESGAIVQPLWRPIYTMTSDKVHDFPAHPSKYHQLNTTWVEG